MRNLEGRIEHDRQCLSMQWYPFECCRGLYYLRMHLVRFRRQRLVGKISSMGTSEASIACNMIETVLPVAIARRWPLLCVSVSMRLPVSY